jgi:hypothetical protein
MATMTNFGNLIGIPALGEREVRDMTLRARLAMH